MINKKIHPAQTAFALMKNDIAVIRSTKPRTMISDLREVFESLGIKPYELKMRQEGHGRVDVQIRSRNLDFNFVDSVVKHVTRSAVRVVVSRDPEFWSQP